MGFGFMVARFGLFLLEMAGMPQPPSRTHGFSVKLGVAVLLALVGVATAAYLLHLL